MDLSRYLTTAAAAARLGVTPSRVRQLVMDGQLTSRKIGRDHLFLAADVEAYRPANRGWPKGKKRGPRRKSLS